MADPTGFFCFTHDVLLSKKDVETWVFAYKPPGLLPPSALDELMLSVCKGPKLPDAVVVLGLEEERSKIDLLGELQKETVKLAQQRLQGRIPLIFARLSLTSGKAKATLLDKVFTKKKSSFENTIERKVHEWVSSGLSAIFDAREIVLRAPAGYAYQKPSGARSEFFLKPDLALRSSATVGFVALAVFLKRFSGRVQRIASLQTVLVDTMAISPVAYGLSALFNLFSERQPFNIESFHSYGGFDDVAAPFPGSALCLISASSSMALHDQWVARKNANHEEVVTLVTFASAEKNKEHALLVISIRIKGETFLPTQELPKKILLTDKHHRSDQDVDLFREFAGKGVFDVYRRPPLSNSKPRALYVDGSRLIEQPNFTKWLSEQLLHLVKAAVRVIVHQNDKPSMNLSQAVASYCEDVLKTEPITVMSASHLVDANLTDTVGVIVCAAVVGKGSGLFEISRTLRDKHTGPRLYLIGYQVCETMAELSSTIANLKHSKTVDYQVARFGQAAIGTQLGHSFAAETTAYYSQSVDTSNLPKVISARAAKLGSTQEIMEVALLPYGTSLDGRLALRAGFAYWTNAYIPQACQPEVLATIAVLLQRARESSLVPDERRLASSSFQQVVLAPENFTRFNDGVIQAALLRCAYPSELDYRDDHAASDFMKAVILRLLTRSAQEAGEAILEFLLAISQGRLMLLDAHTEEIKDTASKLSFKQQSLSRAIAFILSVNKKHRSVKRRLPF
jgi:hypothetical protein